MNNDCHCHCCCYYMQRIYVYFILSWFDFSCLELTSVTIVIIGMTLYELVSHYHIISYHIWCSFILSLLLIWFPFHFILFYSILLNSIYCIVQHSISYQWMICVYLSVCLSVCMNKVLSYCLSEQFTPHFITWHAYNMIQLSLLLF